MSENTPNYDQRIESEFQALLSDYINSNHRKKVEVIEKAFRFANEAHKGVKRRSGEPYILHPIAVARIACREIGLGSTSICAALLHDVVEDTEYTAEDIEGAFGKKIAGIVVGLTKISGGIFGDQASAQAENFRKLLLTMSEDIRVVLIKMADRLHNMRTLEFMTPSKQYKIAGETLYIYAPLAHRLGLFAIKTELEDLSFKYEHPDAYVQILQKIADTEAKREISYANFAAPIIEQLKAQNIDFEIKARVKSVYSIWNKMQTKNIPFEEVYDLYAVRIIFKPQDEENPKKECWNIYSIITDIYKVHPDRIRDWISRPKANGYQALHLTVMGPQGSFMEVQIRTEEMDAVAERGFAAHWKYKVGNENQSSELDKWLKTIKEILENPEPNALDFLDTIKLNLFASEIFVFTPKGELRVMPTAATALDFAFSLHSEMGYKSIAAKVNHKLVPLSHKLQSGDQVEILTSKSQTPKEEWLDFVTTATAKTKLQTALRKEKKNHVVEGEHLLKDFLAKQNLELSPQLLAKLLAYFKVEKKEELFLFISTGEFVLDEALSKHLEAPKNKNFIIKYLSMPFALNKQNSKKENTASKETKGEVKTPQAPTETPKVINRKKAYLLKDEDGVSNYTVATCCHPIKGDDVLGFVENNSVVVHKRQCPVAMKLKSSYGQNIVTAHWDKNKENSFEANVEIQGIDHVGVLSQITHVISTDMNVNIKSIHLDTAGEIFTGKIKFLVKDIKDIHQLCNNILKVPDVMSAKRIE